MKWWLGRKGYVVGRWTTSYETYTCYSGVAAPVITELHIADAGNLRVQGDVRQRIIDADPTTPPGNACSPPQPPQPGEAGAAPEPA